MSDLIESTDTSPIFNANSAHIKKNVGQTEFNHFLLLKHIQVNEITGCWLWNSTIKKDSGYGVLMVRNRKIEYAHRLSYEIFVGFKDSTTVIDHMCRHRICINPDHLREVSRDVNTTENSLSASARNKSKSHCKRGHLFDESNTIFFTYKDGRTQRTCKTCRKEQKRISDKEKRRN